MCVFIVLEVTMANQVKSADESRVWIECVHTCSAGAEFQYLWTMRAFEYDGFKTLNLHDDSVKARVNKDLGVNISMTSDDGCGEDSMRRFYLDISGINISLNRTIVSCGVTKEGSSIEVYCPHDGYILIATKEAATRKYVAS